MFGKAKIAPLVAEFLGTFTLAAVVMTIVARNTFPYYPAFVAGLTLGLLVLAFGAVSGAHVNPAVTIGLWVQRRIETTTAIVYVIAQMAGGFVAWRVGQWLLNINMTNIGGSAIDARVLVAEIIGTTIFAAGIAAAIDRKYEGVTKAIAIGGSLGVGILVASLGGNAALNPAVALGTQTWSLSYVLGPIVGAVLGMALYNTLLAPAAPAKAARKKI